MTNRSRPRALLIQLEFPNWHRARSWAFSAGYGIRDALIASGIECVTIPAIADIPVTTPDSWLFHARRLYGGQRFDQAWVWLVHTPLDEPFLDWLTTVAPVRIGILMESLRYDPEDYAVAPNLLDRPARVAQQLRRMTHLLVPDERDVAEIRAHQPAGVLWCPTVVPERSIVDTLEPPADPHAVFHGMVYGERKHWITHPALQGRMVSAPSQTSTPTQRLFDLLQHATMTMLQSGVEVTERSLGEYVESLYRIRSAEFTEWMQGLVQWAAVVNLPSMAKFYGGRVFEGMAAGRPVISWDIPNHPRNRALFESGREILLYDKSSPEALADQIDRLQGDPGFARDIAENARDKIRRYHTAEVRIGQVLRWIETGAEPDYGERTATDSAVASDKPNRSGSTTSKDLSVIADEAKINEYYVDLFVKNPITSTPRPGPDESARWAKIEAFLKRIVHEAAATKNGRVLRILDVGCGRGWLTNLACAYGQAEGVEPVAEVVNHARKCFPHLRFFVGTPETVLKSPDFKSYDIILSSEVIEHVPHHEQSTFVASLLRLLKPGGYVILTTPRAEAFEQFRRFYTPDQPIEDWLSEQDIAALFARHGFHSLDNDRIYLATPDLSYVLQPSPHEHRTRHLIGVYQVWAFQSGEKQSLDAAVAGRASSDEKADPLPNVLESEQSPVGALPQANRCVLIVSTHFPPSIGGLETVAAQLGKSLIARGYDVHVATERLATRAFTEYCGMTIHSLDPVVVPGQRLPQAAFQLRDLIASGRYNACILLADPRNWIFWSLEGLEIPERTRMIAQPLINADGFARWRMNNDFRIRLTQILKRVHSVVTISTCGVEVQYLKEEGIPFAYIPNAVERDGERDDFRARYGIPEVVPLFLHVANLWPVKNHLGLMDTLSAMSGDWRLVMIGHSSGDSQYDRQVHEAVQRDPRFMLIPGLPRNEIAAALNAADILLLASHGEVAPVTVLEAMSHATPWLATPQCGGVHDNAGGLIVPIEDFPSTLSYLVKNPHMLLGLGELGYKQWRECFRWDVVIRAWDSLIQTGASSVNFAMPTHISEEMQSVRDDILQGVRSGLAPAAPALASPSPMVSVIVPTYNRPDTLIIALRSILDQTYQDFEIIVVNDAGSDVENIVRFLDKDGKITYIRHGSNHDRAAARNTAIKVARGKYIAYLDDDDLYYPDHLETLVAYLQKNGSRVAYTDAHRAHQEKRDGRYVVTKREIAYSLEFDYDRILVHNFVPVLCLMHEKACLDIVGCFDESLTTHEDWDLLIRLSRRFQCAHIKKITCEFVSRTDGSTTTSSKLPDFRRTMAIVLERHMASASEKPHVRAAQERILQRLQGRTAEVHVAAQPVGSQQIAALLQRAEEYCKAGDLQEAKEVLGQALEILPDDPQLILTFGNIVLRLDDVEGARREFLKATALHPGYAPAHADLAAVLLHLGRGADAERSARRALELDSTNISALKILAKVCLDTERYQEAVQAYATILQHAPDDIETLILVGNCYAETGRFEQARGFYGKALGLDPGNQIATDNLAEVERLAAVAPATVETGTSNGAGSDDCPSASIVIVTYNSAATVRACLDSVLSESRSRTELVVVDNASTDTTRAILDNYGDRITVILNPENRGFSAACNQGIRTSSGECIVLLNPDTVVTPGWLERFMSHLGPDVGAVGPVSDYAAGLQNIDRNLPDGAPKRMGLLEVSDLLGRANHGQAKEVKLLTGFCLMLPRRVLDDVGLLDETLFLGNDDLDLSWRLRLKGYKLLVATDSFIHHEGQVSFNSELETKTSRLVQESTDRLYAKLEAHYGADNVPSPMELWGIDWFRPTKSPHPPFAKGGIVPLTSIIVLTHNGLEHTKQCLTSIEAHTPEPHELIIVDNGSIDGTLAYLRDYTQAHEHVRIIANQGNRGFAAGNNQGLALARGDYLLLLNNDTIVTEGWLTRMLRIFEAHPDVGIVGPMSNYVSGPQLVRGTSYQGLEGLDAFAAGRAQSHDGQSREATRVVGFCLLTRTAVIARIGGLDEQFGSGNFEDDDFCIRAFQVGFRARIADDVFIHHTGSRTFKTAGIDYRQSMERNWERFKAKWGIPIESSLEQGYRFPMRLVDESRLVVPLPDLRVCRDAEMNGRWWRERQQTDVGTSVDTVQETAENGRIGCCTVVVRVDNDRPHMVWQSLALTTDRPMAIVVSDGHGVVDETEIAPPDGWALDESGEDPVRLLNMALERVGDDPVVLLSTDLVLTEGWFERLRSALADDPDLAIVAPTAGRAPRPQRITPKYEGVGKSLRRFARHRRHEAKDGIQEADYLGGFCLVLNREICRSVGGLKEELGLAAALRDLFGRLRGAGYRLAVALDVYVHHEFLSMEEGATYDELAQVESAWRQTRAEDSVLAFARTGGGR